MSAKSDLFGRWLKKIEQIGLTKGDLVGLLEVNPTPESLQSCWKVIQSGKYHGLIGVAIGTIGLRHSHGYAVALRLPDGKTIVVPPMWLAAPTFPVPADYLQKLDGIFPCPKKDGT